VLIYIWPSWSHCGRIICAAFRVKSRYGFFRNLYFFFLINSMLVIIICFIIHFPGLHVCYAHTSRLIRPVPPLSFVNLISLSLALCPSASESANDPWWIPTFTSHSLINDTIFVICSHPGVCNIHVNLTVNITRKLWDKFNVECCCSN